MRKNMNTKCEYCDRGGTYLHPFKQVGRLCLHHFVEATKGGANYKGEIEFFLQSLKQQQSITGNETLDRAILDAQETDLSFSERLNLVLKNI